MLAYAQWVFFFEHFEKDLILQTITATKNKKQLCGEDVECSPQDGGVTGSSLNMTYSEFFAILSRLRKWTKVCAAVSYRKSKTTTILIRTLTP